MPKANAKPKDDAAMQSARFIDTARELGCDDSPDAFEAAVKKVARHKPVEGKASEPEKQNDETSTSKMDRQDIVF